MEYQCQKCGNIDCERDTIRATGNGLSRMFDIQNKKFDTVSCKRCGYTEMYKRQTSKAGNILDFLFGN